MKKSAYTPHPQDTSNIQLSPDLVKLVEKMSENVHEVWALTRLQQGWTYGEKRNDEKKEHPCLIPYDALDDSEKEYDRNTSVETLKLILSLGYKIVRE